MSQKLYCIAEHCVFMQTNGTGAQIDGMPVEGPLLAKKGDGGEYEYVQPEETEAFILRLLLQQLEIPLINQALIWKSLGQLDRKEAQQLIQGVIDRYTAAGFIQAMGEEDPIIKGLRIPRQQMLKHHQAGGPAHMAKNRFRRCELNATINQIGPIVIRFTFPPLR